MKARFQYPVGGECLNGIHTVDFDLRIATKPLIVGNRSSLLQRESTDNEPTNLIYEIRSTIRRACKARLLFLLDSRDKEVAPTRFVEVG
ncbi:MAG: hypothetical protein OXI67_15480 [Candidatus Poribacteria bacterium]|nr:hypothetical protein [Candidatus Poribacteria bacterium]